MNKKTDKNLFLAIILMFTTLCMGCANVVKDARGMNNKDNIPEENLPASNKDTEKTPPIMAGKVLPPKEKPEEKLEPLSGDVMPLPPEKKENKTEVSIPPLAGVVQKPDKVNKDNKNERSEPPSVAGDIPPRNFKINEKQSGFEKIKSFMKKFKKDKDNYNY